jgi:micrococcal nuclease
MIGVDTPETRDPRKPVQCYGAEASRFTKEILLKQNVTISFDETQGIRDKYDRLLVYIWLPDGRLFNQLLISEGYAFEYTYNDPYTYQAEFIAAENDARTAQRGLWAPTSCNGVASPVTPTP